MRGTRTLVSVSVLVVAACGGSADSTSTTESPSTTAGPSATTVTSDDGIIAIEVPADTGVEVTITTSTEEPAEFEGIPLIGPVYELGPDGATFDTPVTITATFEAADLPDDHPANLAFPVLLSSDGTLDILDDLVIEFDADGGVVSGTTTHFSSVVYVQLDTLEGLVAIDPDRISLPVGDSFEAEVEDQVVSSVNAPRGLTMVGWTVSNPTVLSGGGSAPTEQIGPITNTFTCEEAGSSSYSANVQFRDLKKNVTDVLNVVADANKRIGNQIGNEFHLNLAIAAEATGTPGVMIITFEVVVEGNATCTEEEGDALCEPDDTHACYVVPIGDYLAHIRAPREIEEGEIQGEVCVTDLEGKTLDELIEWFFSWFPDSGQPSHTNTMIDGCGPWSMQILSGPPGSLWTSDGQESARVADYSG